MAPRRNPPKEPWWSARASILVALAIAIGGGWVNETRRASELAMQARLMPDRRDREVDALERCMTRQLDLISKCGRCP